MEFKFFYNCVFVILFIKRRDTIGSILHLDIKNNQFNGFPYQFEYNPHLIYVFPKLTQLAISQEAVKSSLKNSDILFN